jgi:hypothetical protein
MRLRAGLALIILAACAAASSAQGPGAAIFRHASEVPALSNRCVILLPPEVAQGGAAYRFAGSSSWLPFDLPLELDAAYGEDRSYALEVREGPDSGIETLALRIDRLPPRAPVLSPASGLYRDGVTLAISAEVGAKIRYSISRAGAEAGPFLEYGADGRPDLGLPATGSETYVVMAYAVDEAGNAGVMSKATYRLAAPGPEYAAPAAGEALPESSAGEVADLPEPAITPFDGHVLLDFRPPEGRALYVSVNPAATPASIADFLPLAASGGKARLDLPSPPGWSGKARVYVGLLEGGSFVFRAAPLELVLGDGAGLARPEAPALVASVPGGPVWLSFPPYQGEIRCSIDGAEFARYEGPIALPAGKGEVKVSWYGRSPQGEESERSDATLLRPLSPPAVSLAGVGWDEVLNHDATLEASGGLLRYELRTDGSMPPEPGPASPMASASLQVSCPEGEERNVIIRYRGYSSEGAEAVGGEGGILRFRIDRKPPSPPEIVGPALAYSSVPLSVSFNAQEGRVMAAVDTGGNAGAFAAAPPMLGLPGSPDGPVTYRVRAYAVDEAGNRSVEATPLVVTVDVATVYVAEDGSDSGDGSRAHPFASLDAGLALVLGSGGQPRTALAIRGRVQSSGSVTLPAGTRLAIKGGFDAAWDPQPGAVSAIVRERASGPLLVLSGANLRIEGLAIEAGDLGNPVLFSVAGSTLVLSGVSVAAASDGDVLFLDAAGSSLSLEGSSVSMEGAVSACIIQARDCDISVQGSRLAAGAGVRYYSGVNAAGGSLSLGSSAFSSRAVLGTRLVALQSGRVDVSASYFDVRGSAGFLSIGSFSDCTGNVSGSTGYLEWGGNATLFSLRGASPAFIQDSFYAVTAKGSIRFFDCTGTGPLVRNCILGAKGSRNELLVSDRKSLPGEVAANCLWGFSSYLSGAFTVRDLAVLNAYNAADGKARPNLAEAPSSTFAELPPASFELADGSACRGAGMDLPGYPASTAAGSMAGTHPDIGAVQSY